MHPVGYVVHVKSPGTLGGETRSYQLAQALGKIGADVHLYGQIDRSFDWSSNVHPHQLKRPVPLGVMQLLHDFYQYNVKVVIERYQLPPFNPGVFAQRVRGIPIILEVHGFPIEEYALIAKQPDLKVSTTVKLVSRLPSVIWERFEKDIFQHASHLIVTSSGTKDILVSMGIPPEKVSVVYNCVDPDLFNPAGHEQAACRASLNLPSYGQLVLFAGTFTEELDAVFEAASEVIAQRPSTLFIFAVNGSFSLLRHMANSKGLNDQQFCILSAFQHNQIPGLLAAVDVVLAPYSLHSERFRKGFHYSPLKVLEALAMEKSIVTIDAAELRTIFGSLPNIQFVESGSSQGWVEGILHALDLNSSPLLKHGRTFVMNGYSWQDAAKKYFEIIQSVENNR